MDRKRVFTIMAAAFFFIVTFASLTMPNLGYAGDCTIIKIQGAGKTGKSISVDPVSLQVAPGTCVIWVNFTQTQEVRVNFRDGKTCSDVTDAPSGFTLDAQECYVTNYIALGGTSSLRFNDEGTYEYSVEFGAARERGAEGKIIVKGAKCGTKTSSE